MDDALLCHAFLTRYANCLFGCIQIRSVQAKSTMIKLREQYNNGKVKPAHLHLNKLTVRETRGSVKRTFRIKLDVEGVVHKLCGP